MLVLKYFVTPTYHRDSYIEALAFSVHITFQLKYLQIPLWNYNSITILQQHLNTYATFLLTSPGLKGPTASVYDTNEEVYAPIVGVRLHKSRLV